MVAAAPDTTALATTSLSEVMSVGLPADSREILSVGFAVHAEVQDALADDGDKIACGTAALGDFSAESLVRVARDQQLGLLDRTLHDFDVESFDRRVHGPLESENFAVRVMIGASP